MNKNKDLNSALNLVYDEVILNHRQKHKMHVERRKQAHLVWILFWCYTSVWFLLFKVIFPIPALCKYLRSNTVTLSSPDRPLLTHTEFVTPLFAKGQHQKVTEIDLRWSEIRLFFLFIILETLTIEKYINRLISKI